MPLSLEDIAPLAALSSVTAAMVTTPLLGANRARRGVMVANDSTALMYIAYAATASTTAYSVAIPGSSSGVPYVWEMPATPVYTGPLSAVWSAANGAARCTEL